MLIVIAHVEGNPVQGSVIRVRLESLGEHVMLTDKVSSHRVQAHRQDRAHNQVDHHFPAEKVHDNCVECQLDDCVDYLVPVRGLGVHNQRPEDVEERLQAHPEELAECRAEELRLE